MCVIIAALVFALTVSLAFTDIFALSEDGTQVRVSVPQGAAKGEISALLKESGLIRSRILFHLYTALRGKEVRSAGVPCEIPKNSGYDGICRILALGSAGERTQVRVVIPEGSSVEKIMEIVCDGHGICTREEFTNEVQNGDFSKYSFQKIRREQAPALI